MDKARTEDQLGYAVYAEPVETCLDDIMAALRTPGPCRVLACINPHSVVVAHSDAPFDQALHRADWLVPDGVGMVYASSVLGGRITERITGSDIFNGLNVRMNAEGGCTCFFLGAWDRTLERIVEKLGEDYPAVRVVGVYPPPYRHQFSDEENETMISIINAVKPDVLWVGLTAPKQEKWIEQHRDRLQVKFAAGIGAVFDFYIGNVRRSSPFFLKHGLEWLPRLLQEPKRLWRRNFVSNPTFVAWVLRERLRRFFRG